jgi:hypothetical protein
MPYSACLELCANETQPMQLVELRDETKWAAWNAHGHGQTWLGLYCVDRGACSSGPEKWSWNSDRANLTSTGCGFNAFGASMQSVGNSEQYVHTFTPTLWGANQGASNYRCACEPIAASNDSCRPDAALAREWPQPPPPNPPPSPVSPLGNAGSALDDCFDAPVSGSGVGSNCCDGASFQTAREAAARCLVDWASECVAFQFHNGLFRLRGGSQALFNFNGVVAYTRTATCAAPPALPPAPPRAPPSAP